MFLIQFLLFNVQTWIPLQYNRGDPVCLQYSLHSLTINILLIHNYIYIFLFQNRLPSWQSPTHFGCIYSFCSISASCLVGGSKRITSPNCGLSMIQKIVQDGQKLADILAFPLSHISSVPFQGSCTFLPFPGETISYNELSQKPGFNLYDCAYITYSVKTWF